MCARELGARVRSEEAMLTVSKLGRWGGGGGGVCVRCIMELEGCDISGEALQSYFVVEDFRFYFFHCL